MDIHAVLATLSCGQCIGYRVGADFVVYEVWVTVLSTLEEHYDIRYSLHFRCLKTKVPGSYHPYTENGQSIYIYIYIYMYFFCQKTILLHITNSPNRGTHMDVVLDFYGSRLGIQETGTIDGKLILQIG